MKPREMRLESERRAVARAEGFEKSRAEERGVVVVTEGGVVGETTVGIQKADRGGFPYIRMHAEANIARRPPCREQKSRGFPRLV